MAEALEAQREALAGWTELAETERVGNAQRWMSRLTWFSGDTARAWEYAALATATLEGTGGVEEAMAASNRAQLGMLAFDLDTTRHWAGRALSLVEGRTDRAAEEVRVHALNNLGAVEIDSGDAAGAGSCSRTACGVRRRQTCTSTPPGRSPTSLPRAWRSTTTPARAPTSPSARSTARTATSTPGACTCAGSRR